MHPNLEKYRMFSVVGADVDSFCVGAVANRVRVAVRLRPRNPEELVADTDFADCVELQPEVPVFRDVIST